MILGDVVDDSTTELVNDSRTMLDDLFRRAAVRRPGAVALVDPPNRETFTDGAPRTLTYAEADRVVWTIAARLRQLGLQTDAIVAMQLPNTVESVLVILGVLRAGMIAVPLPMLWRKAEITAALAGTGVKMLVTCARIGEVHHDNLAMHSAAELFSIRHVGAFGSTIVDGVVLFDDVFANTADISPVAPAAVIPRPCRRRHLGFDTVGSGRGRTQPPTVDCRWTSSVSRGWHRKRDVVPVSDSDRLLCWPRQRNATLAAHGRHARAPSSIRR